ncbi:hypothetical protein EYF80_022363 [Liparis tanakae]|uniref:Uncharacterized protein n=1 Tax=Liparis tanakae TaxID=230148 RepID=A0A4Z2HNM0_9TELE|nr:hypothetical protein EYF80_022363 [Liparis tanakae]
MKNEKQEEGKERTKATIRGRNRKTEEKREEHGLRVLMLKDHKSSRGGVYGVRLTPQSNFGVKEVGVTASDTTSNFIKSSRAQLNGEGWEAGQPAPAS